MNKVILIIIFFYFLQGLAEPLLSLIPEQQVGAPRSRSPGRALGRVRFRGSRPSPLAHRRLEQNFFNCSCDIRWMQLWQEQGEAQLNSQDLYCVSAGGARLPLFRMNISQCGELRAGPGGPSDPRAGAARQPGGPGPAFPTPSRP